MSELIQNILSEYCYTGEEHSIIDRQDLSKFTSNFITVKYEASPKSSQTMIHKTILIDDISGNKIEIRPADIQVIFRKDGTVDKTPPSPINALTIIDSIDGVNFTHLVHVQDGNAILYNLGSAKF